MHCLNQGVIFPIKRWINFFNSQEIYILYNIYNIHQIYSFFVDDHCTMEAGNEITYKTNLIDAQLTLKPFILLMRLVLICKRNVKMRCKGNKSYGVCFSRFYVQATCDV